MCNSWKDELWTAIATAKNASEVRDLMAALLTPAEVDELSRRWQIVKNLIQGKSQREVRDVVGVSIATVERGAREIRQDKKILKTVYRRLYSKNSSEG